jgi:ubiquinone/menaquinone biosynthesis C-methylase UbiE
MTTDQTVNPARAYQDYYGPAIFEPLAGQVLARATPADGDHVLDVACGTGIVTRRAATAAGPRGRAVGVDISPVMLEVAGAIDPPAGSAPIDLLEGDGSALDLPDETFDLSYCQQGLQFFPDRPAAASEMRRVLRDGGRAVIAVWRSLDHHPLYEALAAAEQPHLAAIDPDLSSDGLTTPFSFGDPEALRRLLVDAGFARVEITGATIEARFSDADHFVERLEFAYTAVDPAFGTDPATFRDYVDAVAADTSDVVEEHRDGDHVVVPMHANVAVAWRGEQG